MHVQKLRGPALPPRLLGKGEYCYHLQKHSKQSSHSTASYQFDLALHGNCMVM